MFYVWGALLGILLISQFWTLANGIYDPRQAKRLFGFVGGGVTLGGATGSRPDRADRAGGRHQQPAPVGAPRRFCCAGRLSRRFSAGRRGRPPRPPLAEGGARRHPGAGAALLRGSRQIQIIALIISFGSLGAALLDQQVNMAAEVFKGAGQEDSIGAFLAQIRFYTSAAAFVIQVWITPRIHRYLGIGFALLILPTNLSITAAIILLNNALWAPALARVTDQSFRTPWTRPRARCSSSRCRPSCGRK